MVLSKQLIIDSCEPTEDIGLIIDSKDGSEMMFITLGILEFNDNVYLFGANFDNYLQQLASIGDEIDILVFKIIEDEIEYHSLCTSDFVFSDEEEADFLHQIEHKLNTIRVAQKYEN